MKQRITNKSSTESIQRRVILSSGSLPQSSDKPEHSSASAFSHSGALRVISGVILCILLAALDQTVVIPALPAIASDFGAYEQLSWVIAAYLITSTISTPIYGKLSDTYGRRRLLLVAISIFIATSILCALAQSLPQLIWFRALQGLGGGGLMALAQAAIADGVPPRERGRYQGYLSAVWAVASVSGPIVGGLVTEHWSWHWIFWINLPLGTVAMWACHKGLKRLNPSQKVERSRIDLMGMVILTGAISCLLLANVGGNLIGSMYVRRHGTIRGVLRAGAWRMPPWHYHQLTERRTRKRRRRRNGDAVPAESSVLHPHGRRAPELQA